MNAYELADELLRDNTQLTVTSAYMLRQQADRIRELEEGLEKIIEGCRNVKADDELNKHAKELATLVIKDCNMMLGKIQK